MHHEPAEPTQAADSSTNDENAESAAEDENLERGSQEDESVPEKQIQRWKDEGGAWMPS